MSKLASINISKSDVLPETDEFEEDYDSIKLISQEVIEQKEAIIQQMCKQLKDQIKTIDLLASQLQIFKKSSLTQISLSQLQEKGFLRKQSQHYFFIVDATKAIQQKKAAIKIDTDLQIINEGYTDKLQKKLKELQIVYQRAMERCDCFLQALAEKEQAEVSLKSQIEALKKQESNIKQQMKLMKETIKMFQIENRQLKEQHEAYKHSLDSQRQQLCLQISGLKKLNNDYHQRTKNAESEIRQLRMAVNLQQQKIKGFQLQKMERDYFQQDLQKSYKQSIKFIDYQSQFPQSSESQVDKQNQINLSNLQLKTSKQSEKFSIRPLLVDNPNLIAQNEQKIKKQLFVSFSPEESKQSSPTRQHNIEIYDQRDIQDSFPQANTIGKYDHHEEQLLKMNGGKPQEILRNKEKEKVKHKGRKLIRINF